ncbi:hypothetical protein ACFX19_028415 [Malus domestica]
MMSSYPPRGRPLPPPARSYDRRPPVPAYPKSSFKREYSRREDLPPPRSRAASDYGSRAVQERHQFDMKGILPLLLQVTVKGVHVNMTILVQNVPTLHWMMFLPIMLMRPSTNPGHG